MSSVELPEHARSLINGIKVRLIRANPDDCMHNVGVAGELKRVIANDAKEHGVEYNDKGFPRVMSAYRGKKIQAYFLIVERENCQPISGMSTPLCAGGAIQFPTVLTEWNGNYFEHFPAVYSEDTWVDRGISDEVRRLTKSLEYPKGIGLGTFNTQARIRLSAAGSGDDLPFGMVAKARISENASDNGRQLAIISKLGAGIDLDNAVLQFDGSNLVKRNRRVEVNIYGLGAQPSDNGIVAVLPNVFLTAWSNLDGSQQIVGSHTEAISTASGDTIVRSQFTSNNNLPPQAELQDIMSAMVFSARAQVVRRGWVHENDDAPSFIMSPIIRAHAYGRQMSEALKAIGGKPRYFGSNHLMVPGAINYGGIPDPRFRSRLLHAKPLIVIDPPYTPRAGRATNGRSTTLELVV
jgi:hypothetical protein